jgi:MarR-like DNA-binding transcriptional regulator SgrR of sgrS sRNA
VPHNFLNGKDHSSSVNLFLKLAQSASIEEVVEDLAEIASEKGIHLHSVIYHSASVNTQLRLNQTDIYLPVARC